jgi:tetratricopeptide (TPR) repeat protein
MNPTWRYGSLLLAAGSLASALLAQQPPPKKMPPKDEPPPRSDQSGDNRTYSTSRDTVIDLSPPPNDIKDHPESRDAVEEATGVQEFHKWNPMKALKDVEVGDFYFRRKNYRAALARYQEALEYKPNDAIATFRLAQCQEKTNDPDSARDNYAAYLKILPNGPFAEEAKKSLERLEKEPSATKAAPQQAPPPKQ